MREYEKIETIFLRDDKTKKLKEEIFKEQAKHRTKYGRVSSLFDFGKKMNFIIFSGHFHIKFKNGYEVSLFNGTGSYTDNLYAKFHEDEEVYSKYIELAIIKDDYFYTRDFIETVDDDVIGLIDPEELIDILNKVKNA